LLSDFTGLLNDGVHFALMGLFCNSNTFLHI